MPHEPPAPAGSCRRDERERHAHTRRRSSASPPTSRNQQISSTHGERDLDRPAPQRQQDLHPQRAVQLRADDLDRAEPVGPAPPTATDSDASSSWPSPTTRQHVGPGEGRRPGRTRSRPGIAWPWRAMLQRAQAGHEVVAPVRAARDEAVLLQRGQLNDVPHQKHGHSAPSPNVASSQCLRARRSRALPRRSNEQLTCRSAGTSGGPGSRPRRPAGVPRWPGSGPGGSP